MNDLVQVAKGNHYEVIRLARTKSVQKPSAQSNTLLQLQEQYHQLLDLVMYTIRKGNQSRKLERVVLDLMLSGGLRVSEALNVQPSQVNPLGQVLVKGGKGSKSKLVTPLYFRNEWLNSGRFLASQISCLSRYCLYRFCKSSGIVLNVGALKKNLVTHSMRNLHIYLLKLMELDGKELAEITGHRNYENLKYYARGIN